MLKILLKLNVVFIPVWFSTQIFAWGEHPLGSYPALRALPELQNAKPVVVETLESFLNKEKEGIAELLKQTEQWSVENLESYAPMPAELAFQVEGEGTLESRFKAALRINPDFKTLSYVQMLPGEQRQGCNRIKVDKISIFPDNHYLEHLVICEVKPGQTALPVEIAATASDEPDYGLDIGLFENNKTEFGARYGFSTQPFGNPELVFSSQAPFHMGFFHEAWIVYKLASFLKRTYPHYRARQYMELSKYAFKTGHDYWGYRFMGWGLHYIQDLTQPYHSTSTPNMGTLKKLWVNFLAILGFDSGMKNLIQLLSNAHLALEDVQRQIMTRLIQAQENEHSILQAVADLQNDQQYGDYDERYIKVVLTTESNGKAEALSDLIEEYFPADIVLNPQNKYDSHSGSENAYDIIARDTPQNFTVIEASIADLFRSFGSHTRNYARAALSAKSGYGNP